MKSLIKTEGFTLIEILISLVILFISLLALAGLIATTTRNNSFGGHLTEAATFAQDLKERFESNPRGVLIPGSDTLQGATKITYSRNWNAVITDLPTGGRLWDVQLQVRWTDTITHVLNFPPFLVYSSLSES